MKVEDHNVMQGLSTEGQEKFERDEKIVSTLEGYRQEAFDARRGGLNSRDDRWAQNLDAYWGRHDWSSKATWQARESMPEAPTFVDRFAASLKEALITSPKGFYTVTDPADTEGDLEWPIKRMMDVWLSCCGQNVSGNPMGFSGVFEDQVKLGALMASSSVVTWREDYGDGRVVVETEDPRNLWFDHTGRGLYRIRRKEMDKHQVLRLGGSLDGHGRPIYDTDQIEALVATFVAEEKAKREEITGTGQGVVTPRTPVILDEYYATLLNEDGTTMQDGKALCVVANERFLIRGPEKNPFWHGRDWINFAPLISVPMSVYGKSYVENFAPLAEAFNELTNLILDAVFTSSIKAWVVVPELLSNPGQLADGISPNKMFMLDGVADPKMFAEALEMGNLPAEAFSIWQALKNELREAASQNEIGLGQFAPKGRTSAQEIVDTQKSSSALIRSIAESIETRLLDPTLDLVWKTGLQHVKPQDEMIRQAAGEEMFRALLSRRKEIVKRPITFQARGISTLIQKSGMLRSILNIMQIVGSNELLVKEFLNEVDLGKLVRLLFDLSDIDLTKLSVSARDKLVRQVTEPLQAVAGEQTGRQPGGQGPGAQAAQALGVNANA